MNKKSWVESGSNGKILVTDGLGNATWQIDQSLTKVKRKIKIKRIWGHLKDTTQM